MMEELSVGSKQKQIRKRLKLTPQTMCKRSKLNEREVFKKGKGVTVRSIMATEELNRIDQVAKHGIVGHAPSGK